MKSHFLVFFVFLLWEVGCTNMKIIDKNELHLMNFKDYKEYYITDISGTKYHFGSLSMKVLNDTLIAKGLKINLDKSELFDGTIPVSHINKIEAPEIDSAGTFLLVFGTTILIVTIVLLSSISFGN